MIRSSSLVTEDSSLPREKSSLDNEAYANGYTRGIVIGKASSTSTTGFSPRSSTVTGKLNSRSNTTKFIDSNNNHNSHKIYDAKLVQNGRGIPSCAKLSVQDKFLPQIEQKAQRKLSWAQYLASRQIKFSSRALIAFIIAHNFPPLKKFTSKCMIIQYYNPVTEKAEIGIDDIYFVLLWIVNLTLIRAVLLDYIFSPLAKAAGIAKLKERTRFAEQGWSFAYYSVTWVVGMWLLSNSDYAFSVKQLWVGWPHYQLDPRVKAYYLIQLSCWLSQIYVLNVEERRKDYEQMFAHHIVTCALVIGSYYYYYTRVGHVILISMDMVDILLSGAKMIKYLGYQKLCDIAFGIFLVGWILSKHVLYSYITWSAYYDYPKLVDTKTCFYRVDGSLVLCANPNIHWTFVGLLCVLHAISLMWLWMIIRVVIKIVQGGSAEDSRSDDED